MGQRGGSPPMQFSMMVSLTPVVKGLIIANVVIWLGVQLILERLILQDRLITSIFGLVPNNVIHNFFVWEPFTYMFLHAPNPFHILFNMLLLWWLGSELEQRWGSKFFALYYAVSGVGAAVIYCLAVVIHALVSNAFGGAGMLQGLLTPTSSAWSTPVVGASGAIFGLMLAYGILFGERVVYFMMVFPMRAKYFVMILGGVELVTAINNGIEGSDVANLAHLGGLASGFLFLKGYTRFQQSRWRKQSSRRGRGLKLVVNNDRKEDDDKGGGGGGPKYWN